MDYKPDEQTLIAWLYGELDEQERNKVAQYLEAHPEKKEELRNLAHVREMMGAVEDKEVIVPPFFAGADNRRSFLRLPWVSIPVGIAASLVLLLLGARLIGLQVTYEANRLTMDFGTPRVEQPSLDSHAVQDMINSSLAVNNESMKADWEDGHKKLSESIRKNLIDNRGIINAHIGKLVSEASQASKEQIQSYAAGLQERNKAAIKDYMQLTTAQQKDYLEGLLVDFAKYLQEQRKDDIKVLETRLNGYEQDNSSFKKETEQILSGIISTVNQPGQSQKN